MLIVCDFFWLNFEFQLYLLKFDEFALKFVHSRSIHFCNYIYIFSNKLLTNKLIIDRLIIVNNFLLYVIILLITDNYYCHLCLVFQLLQLRFWAMILCFHAMCDLRTWKLTGCEFTRLINLPVQENFDMPFLCLTMFLAI